jgi:hypothetical protein
MKQNAPAAAAPAASTAPQAAPAVDAALQAGTTPPADTTPQADAPPQLVSVRALIDLPHHGGLAGQVCAVPAAELRDLKASGYVDDDPAALAALTSAG